MTLPADSTARTLILFNYDWDESGFALWRDRFRFDTDGFDLFSFPSNARLVWFDMQRFVDGLFRCDGPQPHQCEDAVYALPATRHFRELPEQATGARRTARVGVEVFAYIEANKSRPHGPPRRGSP